MRETELNDQSASDLVAALLYAGESLSQQLDRALADVGLSHAKYKLLAHLASASEPLALGELAGRTACVRSNITQLVDRLEAEGLVERSADPTDRRSVRASLTPEGRERATAARVLVQDVSRGIARRLAPAELAMMVHLAGRMAG